MPMLNRRRFLGTAAATTAGVGLAACSPGTNPGAAPTGGSGAENVTLPTYGSFEGVTPDLVGDGFVLPNGFFTYPEVDPAAIMAPPGDGEPIRVSCGVGGVMPPVVGQNSYWQALNERIGSAMDYQLVPEADYATRAATVLAGGSLPDIMQLPAGMADLPEVLRARFTDLTPYLSGDKVTEYPYLANLPTYTWEQAVFNGGIYGVQRPLHLYGSFMFARSDLLAAAGASVADVTSGEDFLELCRAVTSPKDNRWAAADLTWMVWFLTEMMGKPYYSQLKWHQDNGAFTHSYETDEYRRALEIVARMKAEGLFHPDAGAMGGTEVVAQFVAGRIALDYRGGAQWSSRVTVDGLDVDVVPPIAWDDHGMGVKALGKGTYTLAAIPNDVPAERVPTLLKVMNFMAAPFGTPEHHFLQYGIEDEHHTRTADGIQKTDTGTAQIRLPNSYVAAPPPELFVAGQADITQKMYDYIESVKQDSLQDAALGLWSDTDQSDGPSIERTLTDTVVGVLRGDKKLEDFDSGLDEWRAAGGDTIRGEYEDAYSEANG